MKRLAAVIGAIATLLISAPAAQASGDLLTRMSALNPGLRSYTATMHAHVVLTTFPFLSTDLVGTYYHKDPDLNKLEITSGLPYMGQQFSKLYPHIEPPARWNDVFVVTQGSDNGKQTTFRLVPRKHGNVEHVDATVDDATATIASMRWNYGNGGWATMENTYSTVNGNVVVTAQTGHVEEPGYKGDITSKLDNYTFNPQLADSLFTQE